MRLENVPQGITVNRVNPTMLDATLNVVPAPSPTPTPQTCSNPCDFQMEGCEGYYDPINCGPSPIIIDVEGGGFNLTDASNGVNFDIIPGGLVERLGWTEPNSDSAFLFLDGNENGVVDNGAELFGNFTPQPASDSPNGFLALAVYDQPGFFGGNGDGLIDSRDEVFFRLRLWQDRNHNGISETEELHTLSELGVESISLDYRESRRRDRYGNTFRYRAKVELRNRRGRLVERWAYDVFFVTSP